MKDQSKNCEKTSRVGPSDPLMLLRQKSLLEEINRRTSPQCPEMHRRHFITSILVHFVWWRTTLRDWLKKIFDDIGPKKL